MYACGSSHFTIAKLFFSLLSIQKHPKEEIVRGELYFYFS